MTDALPLHNPQAQLGADDSGDAENPTPEDIVQVLDSYKVEGQAARKSGANERDAVWEANWNRYWGRYDHSDKAAWQSKHVMPEAPQFIDRWAAAMREALDANPDFFQVVDQSGQSNELTPHITKLMRLLLSRVGMTPDGHRTDFSSVFEDQMKLGALMASCAAVTWKDDDTGGWPAVDSTDPREVWKDPQGRDLYRLRRYEIDKHELLQLAKLTDDDDEPLYNIDVIKELSAQVDEERRKNKEDSSGGSQGGEGGASGRTPIVIDEWYSTIIMPDGTVAAANSLTVVANDRHLIRGPEDNPFWHKQDWITLTPMISVPFSIYGRSYMEDWADVADAFIEMTNLMLDATYTSTIKSFAGDPTQLKDPTQLNEGMSPNKFFALEEGARADQVISEIDLGSLGADAVRVWQTLKQEMQEGAKLSEIALGQLSPNAKNTTATAISEVTQSGSAMIRSMARTIEARFLEPVLTQVWQVALQHMDFEKLAPELGEDTARMLQTRKDEFSERKIRFRVRGISGLIDRQSKLRSLMEMLQITAQNELLLQALFQRTSADKLIDTLFRFMGIDPSDVELTTKERLAQQAAQGVDRTAQQPAAQPAQQPGQSNEQ